jgi:predicted ATP-grasp superfamily ATP-dependent carboligase
MAPTDETSLHKAERPRPWLVAAWPGMGNVAVIAAGYLVHQLKMRQVAELPSRDHFDINEVEAKGGIIGPARLPRGVFFRWNNPAGRDLIVFLGEAQPATGTYAYAHELLETAIGMGISRVLTFASMASGLRPGESPRVMGVATDADTLAELRRLQVRPLSDGQIGGLNGVLLGACAARGLTGECLLAEIPAFAAAVPNPTAARAALNVFSKLSGVEVNLDELNKHAAAVDKALVEAVERAERQESGDEEADEAIGEAGETEPEERVEKPEAASPEPKLDAPTRKHIEQLFDLVRKDPGKAPTLKEELDRLGVFKRYEDRFLDLFRRAG